MVEFLLRIPVGIFLGFLSGLGTGGGSLLVIWLTLVENMEPSAARAINLMFFLAAAGTVSLLRLKSGILDKRIILPAAVSGCITAAIFALVSSHIDPDILKKIFGALLLITGLRELFYRPRKAK